MPNMKRMEDINLKNYYFFFQDIRIETTFERVISDSSNFSMLLQILFYPLELFLKLYFLYKNKSFIYLDVIFFR